MEVHFPGRQMTFAEWDAASDAAQPTVTLGPGQVAFHSVAQQSQEEMDMAKGIRTKVAAAIIAVSIILSAAGVSIAEEFGMRVPRHQEEWQDTARWCVKDKGMANRRYLATCAVADQYDAVLACQAGDSPRRVHAREGIAQAGRAAVNDYMESMKPVPPCRKGK